MQTDFSTELVAVRRVSDASTDHRNATQRPNPCGLTVSKYHQSTYMGIALTWHKSGPLHYCSDQRYFPMFGSVLQADPRARI